MARWRSFEHPYYDIFIHFDEEDGRACMEFGKDLNPDDIPIAGEVIRVGGMLFEVAEMDSSSSPPDLYLRNEEFNYGFWWDVSEDYPDLR